MAEQYLYKHRIMTNLDNCFGFDNTQEAADKSDFETNYKASCYVVSDLEMLDTVFLIEKTYAQFKAMITGDITWAMVKLEIATNHYDLYLLSGSQL